MRIVTQFFLSILIAGASLYLYILELNSLTELRLTIPALEKEVKRLEEDNIRLRYAINQFENPVHLMELARKPEFSHLHYPYENQILILPKGQIAP